MEAQFKRSILAAAAWMLAAACAPARAAEFSLVVGDIYTSDPFANTIEQVAPDGTLVATRTLSGYPMGTKGLAFGPDHTLYVVAVAAHGFDVLKLDAQGQIVGTWSGATYVQGDLSYGKIAVTPAGRVYVMGQSSLLTFVPGESAPTSIYDDNGVYDLALLPSGNLLVLTNYRVVELTPSGELVREVVPLIGVVDGRGILYDTETDTFVTTMLGYTNHFHEMRRWDLATGAMLDYATYTYADDIDQFPDGRMIFGSGTEPVAIAHYDLATFTPLNQTQRMFVAIDTIDGVFADGFGE